MLPMSANVAILYSGADLREVAEAFGEAAEDLSASVRLLRVPGGDRGQSSGDPPEATFADLEWADGIAFGTPVGAGHPSPALIDFIERTEPLWSSAKLFDKVVSVFTDEPEHFAPDPVVHPIYEALYQWGAVIVGPRGFELAFDAQPRPKDPVTKGALSGPRLRTAHYRGRRLTALAGVLAAERARRMRLEL
jgi:NAD(P)H dehydrogenase (quinone)